MRLPVSASRLFVLVALAVIAPAQAESLTLRPASELTFRQPEVLQPGQCVRYEEGGQGWLLPEPLYYLKGEVRGTAVRTHEPGACPVLTGRSPRQYPREAYNRLLRAQPCGQAEIARGPRPVGMVRLRVSDWETPHDRKAEAAGRLWRGMFIDQRLEKGAEIEIEADLLALCEPS